MSTPRKLPWYQFSLRSVLLLTLVVAVLCSLGVSIHWALSAVIASIIAIGGVAGRVVAGTPLGFTQGILFAMQLFFLSVIVSLFCFPSLTHVSLWWLALLYGAAILIGGVLGGLSVRSRSRQYH